MCYILSMIYVFDAYESIKNKMVKSSLSKFVSESLNRYITLNSDL